MDTCKCGAVITIFDACVRISRTKRPSRPERVFCPDCWEQLGARFLQRFLGEQARYTVITRFDQYGYREPPAHMPA